MEPDFKMYEFIKKVLIVAALVAMSAPVVFTFFSGGPNFVNG